MATTPIVTGHGPLSFTDHNGTQRYIPLGAFSFSGSKLTLASAWQTALTDNGCSSGDLAVLQALANERLAANELITAPAPPILPALQFTAASTGANGNNIAIALAYSGDTTPASVLGATVEIQATQTFTYPGLADGAAAVAAIGVDDPGMSSDPAGTGIAMIQESGTIDRTAGALPDDGQSFTLDSGTTSVTVMTGADPLFTLVARSGLPSTASVAISVTLDEPAKTTFTLTAMYQSVLLSSGSPDTLGLGPLGTLPEDIAYLVSVATPASAVPAPIPASTPLTLSGGDADTAATGVAYTA